MFFFQRCSSIYCVCSAGIKPRSGNEAFVVGLGQSHGSPADFHVSNAAAEAPPSMEFLAQRQLSDATTLSSYNVGEADFDGEARERLVVL